MARALPGELSRRIDWRLAMYSVVFELEEMKKHDSMFWLPAGGRDNGVPEENWVTIADFEADDVVPILEMTDGGYHVG
jgi:hypothetical protein